MNLYAETFNNYFANEDRERKRQPLHISNGYTGYNETDLKISNLDWNPVENTVFNNLQNEKIYFALGQLTETQRKRAILFYIYDWMERQIAEHEGVNRYAVRRSLEMMQNFSGFSDITEKIFENLKIFSEKGCAKRPSHSLISRRT